MGAVGYLLFQVGVEVFDVVAVVEQLLLRLLFERDVDDIGHHIESIFEPKITQADLHRKHRAVFALRVQIAFVSHRAHLRTVVEGLAEFFVIPAHARRHQLLDGAGQQLPGFVAKLLVGELVGRHDLPLLIANNDADSGIGKDRFVAPNAMFQLLLGLV